MPSLFQKSFLVCFIVIISFLSGQAQTDSSEYKTYDLIYLKKGGVLKGEILSFDEEFGGIVFKDQNGRKYSLAREEYDYFIEDKAFPVKKRRAVLPRKEKGLEISIGFSGSYSFYQQEFTPDSYYLNAQDAIYDLSFGLKLGVGTFLNDKNYIGLTTDVPFIKESRSFFSLGFRYMYRQDSKKKNAVFYVPIELKYNALSYNLDYATSDTTFFDNGYQWPTDKTVEWSFNSISLNVGPGVSFILDNKKTQNQR